MPKETELYDILEIDPSADGNEIKKAFRKLALKHHPDKGGDGEIYKKIQGAYDILKDENKKEMYDKYGKNGLKGENVVPDDLLNSLFSNMFGGSIFNIYKHARDAYRKTKPTIHHYETSLEKLCQRKIVKLRFTRERICPCVCPETTKICQSCSGMGFHVQLKELGPGMMQQLQTPCKECKSKGKLFKSCEKCVNGLRELPKVFNLHLSPELKDGHNYIFKDEGNQEHGYEPGDFIVVISYKNHENFRLDGNNILYTHSISLKDALSGHTIKINHPSSEEINLVVKDVINPKTEKRIKGKGLNSNGDLIINYDILFPEELSRSQIKEIGKIL